MCNIRGVSGRSDRVGDGVGNVDVLALGKFAVLVLLVVQVMELLQDDLVFARGGVRMLEGEIQPGGDGGDFLAIAADRPLEAGAPVIVHFAAGDRSAGQLQSSLGSAL